MREAFICDGIRTPIGRYGGALSGVRADDLAAIPLRELLVRNPRLDAECIDDVILGCANQAGEDNRNVARMATLLAGLPQSVSGTTINRLWGSGVGALGVAARAVKAGGGGFLIAGGVGAKCRGPVVLGK
ncbi:beta-ketoadipyl CoA thiolase, partial [Escherichia coli]